MDKRIDSSTAAGHRAGGVVVDWSIDSVAKLSPALMWLAGPDGQATYLSPKWLEFVGHSMEEELGDGWAVSVHPDDMPHCVERFTDALHNRKALDVEFRLKRHDGVYRWILDHVEPRYDDAGEFIGFIGTCLDVTELHEAKELIARQRDELAVHAMRDHLTDAYTRRYLFDQAVEEIKRSQRHGHELHMMLLDVDDYKAINDAHGHKLGDEVLVALVDSLKKNVRSIDQVCRYAGDEFCIILPETDMVGAQAIAQRVLAGAREIRLAGLPDIRVSVSIGLAEYSASAMATVEDWIHEADRALYQAKHAGRDRMCIKERVQRKSKPGRITATGGFRLVG